MENYQDSQVENYHNTLSKDYKRILYAFVNL